MEVHTCVLNTCELHKRDPEATEPGKISSFYRVYQQDKSVLSVRRQWGCQEWLFRTCREDGGVGGPWAHLLLRIQLDNTQISVNNSENNLKTGRPDFTAIYWQEAQSGDNQTHGTVHRMEGHHEFRKGREGQGSLGDFCRNKRAGRHHSPPPQLSLDS